MWGCGRAYDVTGTVIILGLYKNDNGKCPIGAMLDEIPAWL